MRILLFNRLRLYYKLRALGISVLTSEKEHWYWWHSALILVVSSWKKCTFSKPGRPELFESAYIHGFGIHQEFKFTFKIPMIIELF